MNAVFVRFAEPNIKRFSPLSEFDNKYNFECIIYSVLEYRTSKLLSISLSFPVSGNSSKNFVPSCITRAFMLSAIAFLTSAFSMPIITFTFLNLSIALLKKLADDTYVTHINWSYFSASNNSFHATSLHSPSITTQVVFVIGSLFRLSTKLNISICSIPICSSLFLYFLHTFLALFKHTTWT